MISGYPPSVMAHKESINFTKLVPELADWNNGNGISIDDWLSCKGDFQLAIAFSRLFWPDFVEHDGCVFFDGFSLESYRGFMEHCKGDRASVEGVMNHRHLLDSFAPASDSATADQLLYLGGVLRDAWQTKLSRDFPSRRFEVTFDHGSPDDLLEYIVTFWQPANRPGG